MRRECRNIGGILEMQRAARKNTAHQEYIPEPQPAPPLEESYIFPRVEEISVISYRRKKRDKKQPCETEGENGFSEDSRPAYSIV